MRNSSKKIRKHSISNVQIQSPEISKRIDLLPLEIKTIFKKNNKINLSLSTIEKLTAKLNQPSRSSYERQIQKLRLLSSMQEKQIDQLLKHGNIQYPSSENEISEKSFINTIKPLDFKDWEGQNKENSVEVSAETKETNEEDVFLSPIIKRNTSWTNSPFGRYNGRLLSSKKIEDFTDLIPEKRIFDRELEIEDHILWEF